VTINGGTKSITNGKIQLAGGTLTDSSTPTGLTIGAGATLSGFGTVAANIGSASATGRCDRAGAGQPRIYRPEARQRSSVRYCCRSGATDTLTITNAAEFEDRPRPDLNTRQWRGSVATASCGCGAATQVLGREARNLSIGPSAV
jgi:hypothetical protein